MKHCKITLKPYEKDMFITQLDVTMEFDKLECRADNELCRVQMLGYSVPGCDPEQFEVFDSVGTVPYRTSVLDEYPYEYKVYYVERAPEGNVCVRYTIYPREYKPEHRCGPYFDFKTETGGANASGMVLIPLFQDYFGEISICWDCSEMPEDCYGVNAFGEGDFTKVCELETIRRSYFAFGHVHSIAEGDFGFYWFGDPYFDTAAIAEYTKKLYAVMAPFFHDAESVYRIFLRKDPYKNSGGTAQKRSYIWGWNDHQPVSVEAKKTILAHEMVHNWPHLNDEPYGVTTWYSEGAAEYYSVVLPLRAGLITKEQALKEIQGWTDSYYTNPTRYMENLEAAAVCWQDRRAQKLAYGRGVFFLANVDAKIRKATAGQKSIDDVVLALLEMDRAGEPLGNEEFIEKVKEISGLDITEDWEIMRTGTHFAPHADSFDSHFHVQEEIAVEADTGNDAVSYRWTLREE
ncbi:MAG: hypothetical protein IJ374_00655 [Lachnospiraceae bacterium]|nr:hypothetical protein [Lachnospiraceae bacterium]